MIKFTELEVSNGHLIISAKVREIEDYYNNILIDKIKIDTQDTFSSTGPSSSLIYESNTIGQKSFTLSLDVADLGGKVDVDKTMFFVYVTTSGTPSPNTPCGMDNAISLGVTFSMCPIYNETMAYIKEIENTCVLPKSLINKILQLKAIQYSINSGHFTQAITYYNKFYKALDVNTTKCGCHG